MEEIRTSEQSKTLYQSLRDGDVLEVVKAYAKATTLDARLKLIPTVHDDTILHMAIYMRQESIAMTIIEISSRDNDELITKRNQFGNTALHEAAATDFVRVVEKLLEKAPALLSIPNEKGEMPLYTAAHSGQKRIFILLAEKLKNNHCDLRPHFSSLSPSYKSVEELDELSYGPEHIRSTILHAAIHAEFFELALLIARKPEYAKIVQLRDKNKKTPLQLLSSNSSAFESGMKCGLIKWLIYKCAPYEDVKEEDAHEQNSSDESHVQSSKRSVTLFLRRVFSSVNRLVWIVLRAWSTMKNIYDERKRHVLALELAKFLIAADFSWDVARKASNESLVQTAVGVVPFPDSEDSGGFGNTTTEGLSAPSLEESTATIPLLIATEHGIYEIVKETLTVHPAAFEYRNTDYRNILHLSILHRQRDIFDLVIKMDRHKSRLQRQLDVNDFTILHYVGNMDYYNGGTQPGPALQLQEELEWFEKVKDLIPLHYQAFRACEKDKDTTLQSFHKRYVEILKDLSKSIDVDKIITPHPHIDEENKKETPIEYFRRTHDPLLEKAQEWLKRTSESGSTVAGLMATVAFTAAFTVPGGNDENSGAPLLLHSPFFLVFIITDALSLASSLTSLVMFLSILTSPFELHDFRHSLPQKLILGFTFLFFSVAVTMLAFASTLMLTIPMKKRVTKSFVYCVAFLPVTMFALLQFPLLLAFKNSLNYSVMAMKSVWFRISAPKSKTAKTQ